MIDGSDFANTIANALERLDEVELKDLFVGLSDDTEYFGSQSFINSAVKATMEVIYGAAGGAGQAVVATDYEVVAIHLGVIAMAQIARRSKLSMN